MYEYGKSPAQAFAGWRQKTVGDFPGGQAVGNEFCGGKPR